MKQGGARLKKKNSKTGRFLTRGLAGCAAFVTAYMLVLPAITKSVHLSGELDGLDVRVETNDNVLPVDTQLQLERVWLPDEEPTDDVSHRLTEDETERILTAALGGSEEYEAKILKAVDISLNYNGNEIEPEDQVRLFLKSDLIREAEQPVVVHLTNSGEAELLEARTTEDGEAMIQFGAFDEEEPAVSDGDAGETDAVSDGTDGETGETLDSDAENTDETLGSDAKDTEETLDGDTDETAKISGSDTGEAADVPDGNADETAKAPGSDTGEAADVSGGDASGVSGGSEDAADGSDEISVTTDGFSVYAIVDLLPREGQDLEFTDSVGGMDVCVTAPYTAFPEGTTMEVSLVENENVIDNVSETVQGEFDVLRAVDITFYNAEGEVIEPAEPISVVIKLQEALDAEKSKLIHIGANETSVMDNATFEEGQVQFDSDEFSTYVIIITLGEPGEQVYHGDGVTITVTYGADANLPKGTEMTVRELEEGTEEYDEYFERTREALNLEGDEVPEENITVEDQLNALFSGGYMLESARFFDIELNYQGEKVEPAAPVDVTIAYDEPVALAAEESESELKIVHFADEGTEIISDVTVEGVAISYQQESFSVTGVAASNVAYNYGNGGWYFDRNENGVLLADMQFVYRYVDKDSTTPQFQIMYPGNFDSGTKSNDWKYPGETGFPNKIVSKDSATLRAGTTIEEILKALATSPNQSSNQYRSNVTTVTFLMQATYEVTDANWTENGERKGGLQETEVWTGEFYKGWGTQITPWKDKNIVIKRDEGKWRNDLGTELIKITGKPGYPIHAREKVEINNGASTNVAVQVAGISSEGEHSLLMMEKNSKITGSGQKGTGVKLDNGGSLEFFDQSKVSNMGCAVEQVNGKLRLKTSPDPIGEANGNVIGLKLHHGQSIGKWYPDISGISKVPVYLVDIDRWNSGDIIMDSGYYWSDEIDPNAGHTRMFAAILETDLGQYTGQIDNRKFSIQNGNELGSSLGVEFYRGSSTLNNKDEYPVGNEHYPVLRFCRSTVLNTRTGIWYRTLYDAVNDNNPIMSVTDKPHSIEEGDTLVFYGNTIEDRNIEIDKNLTIRSSFNSEKGDTNRCGKACTATLSNGAGITVAEGKTVTFGGNGTTTADGSTGTVVGETKGLTLNGSSGGSNIITNNGTLNLKSDVTLASAKNYAVSHQGVEFHLYEGAKLTESGTAEVYLKDNGYFITLETDTPNDGNITRVKLDGTVKNGRDVVLQGEMTLNGEYLEKFPLEPYANQDEYEYVYNPEGSDTGGEPVLELKLRETLVINITKVDKDDQRPLQGAAFQIQYSEGKEKGQIVEIANVKQKGTTDDKGLLQLSIREGKYTLVETAAPNGYEFSNEVKYDFTVSKLKDGNGNVIKDNNGDDILVITDNNNFEFKGNNTYSIKIENTAKTATVQFVKTDGGSGKLAGAEFKLYDKDPTVNLDAESIFTGNSGADGIVNWTSAEGGSSIDTLNLKALTPYYLKETGVPDGYMGMENYATILLTEDAEGKILKLTITGSNLVASNVPNGNEPYIITVVNTPGVVLPSTGGKGTWMLTMTGILLMTGAMVVTLWYRKKATKRH